MDRLARAAIALDGLSVGDAFGQQFFVSPERLPFLLEERAWPREPWNWTDDTAMAISVFEVLRDHARIDRDALARRFADRYRAEPHRGYGGTAHGILQRIGAGDSWERAAGDVFDGQGSMGNGSAMRVAPVGAWFADDLDRVVIEAAASADPTHAHPDGRAGAIAVAIAAACAETRDGKALLDEVIVRTPDGPTREGLEKARALGLDADPRTAVAALGNGSMVICSDTVPFSIWCAARHLDSFEEAMWTTVSGLGDRDTTCAIVGGIVALSSGLPNPFLAAREPLAD